MLQLQPTLVSELTVRLSDGIEVDAQLHREPAYGGQGRPWLEPAFHQQHAEIVGDLADRRCAGGEVDTDSRGFFHPCLVYMYTRQLSRASWLEPRPDGAGLGALVVSTRVSIARA